MSAVALVCAPGLAKASRPNIIVIQTDDQTAGTVSERLNTAQGKHPLLMPNTFNDVFQKGTEFQNYYAASPVCSPSRASLLTGQYPHNNGVETNNGDKGGWLGWSSLPAYNLNVPASLQRTGYRTAHFGKLFNGYYDSVNNQVETTVPPGWDRWLSTSYVSGTHYYGYQANDDGTAIGPVGDPEYRSTGHGLDSEMCTADRLFEPIFQTESPECNYLTDFMTRAAVDEIRRDHESPFYLQIDYQAPHGDVAAPVGPQPATRDLKSAKRTPLPQPENFNEGDISDKPPLIQSYIRDRMSSSEIKTLTNSYRRNIESLRSVDDGVGAIIETLEQTGQLNNTYIIYLSDHGYFFGEHRFKEAKFLPYEAASSVAMAIRGPGVPEKSSSNEVVGSIDIGPTVLDLASATSDYEVDGRSMTDFWNEPTKRSRRPMEISLVNPRAAKVTSVDSARVTTAKSGTAGAPNKAPALTYDAYRVGPYKFIKYSAGDTELYDLKRDPFELQNVIDSPGYQSVSAYMQDHLNEVINCEGSACRQSLPPWPEPEETGTTDTTGSTGTTGYTGATGDTGKSRKAKINALIVRGPRKVRKRRKATFKVKVTNSGDAGAAGVTLRVKGRGVKAKKTVGYIRPHGSKTIEVKLKPKKRGKVIATFRVTSKNAGGKTVRKTLRVRPRRPGTPVGSHTSRRLPVRGAARSPG